jgi:hypothetical protein
MAFSRVKYSGSTPGNDSNTYVLFATILPAAPTDAQNANLAECFFALAGVHKFALLLKCDNAGTIKVWESVNRGTTWRQIDSLSVAAPAATAGVALEFLVESLRDFKLEWTNGGSAQTFFDPNMSLSDDRAAAV